MADGCHWAALGWLWSTGRHAKCRPAAVHDWALPEETELDAQKFMPIEFTLMRGLLTARYVNYIRGRN